MRLKAASNKNDGAPQAIAQSMIDALSDILSHERAQQRQRHAS